MAHKRKEKKPQEVVESTIKQVIKKKNGIEISKEDWDQIKQLLKGAPDDLLKESFAYFLAGLRDRNSQIRLRTFILIDRLVQRSVVFRREVASRLREVLKLTVGSDRCKLPPPLEESQRLKQKTIETLEVWHHNYSAQHPEIRVAYLHITDVVGLVTKGRREEDARVAEDRRKKSERSLRARYESNKEAMKAGLQELRDLLIQMEACFDIIVPDMRQGMEAVGEASVAAAAPLSVDSEAEGEGMEAVGGTAAAAAAAAATTTVESLTEDGRKDNDDIEWESANEDGHEDNNLQEEGGGGGGGEGGGGGKKLSHQDDSENDDAKSVSSSSSSSSAVADALGFDGALGNASFYEIEVELGPLDTTQLETADVKPVFDQLREMYGVLSTRLLPQIEQWCGLLERSRRVLGGGEEQVEEGEGISRDMVEGGVQREGRGGGSSALQECLDLHQDMMTARTQAIQALNKCRELAIKRKERTANRKRNASTLLPPDVRDLQSFLIKTDKKRHGTKKRKET